MLEKIMDNGKILSSCSLLLRWEISATEPVTDGDIDGLENLNEFNFNILSNFKNGKAAHPL